MTRYNLANVCYVVVEPEILAEHEAPRGWGLLVRDGEELVLLRKPQRQPVGEVEQLALLTQIAKSGIRQWNKQFGVTTEFRDGAET